MSEPTAESLEPQRVACEQHARWIRDQLAAWEKADAVTDRTFLSKARRALLWSAEQRWRTRIEALATALEREAVTLRGRQLQLGAGRTSVRSVLSRFLSR